MIAYCEEIKSHYSTIWHTVPLAKTWTDGPIKELPMDFCVLEFAPNNARRMWTYATCCMSQPSDVTLLELHLFSPIRFELYVELLTAIAHYHRTGQVLGFGHTVNFGRPWLGASACEYGLISLPYLDGPDLEQFRSQQSQKMVNCLWLIPITESERNYKKAQGLEALELKFDEWKVNYLDPTRFGVV